MEDKKLLQSDPSEGSHNGSAAVLKTAGRKAMQVRVLSPPPEKILPMPSSGVKVKENREKMGAVLKEARIGMGLSIAGLADKIKKDYDSDIGTTTIREIERGYVKNPGFKTVEIMCKGLELPPLEVIAMLLDDPPPTTKQRFSRSRFAILADLYEPLTPARKVFWDEVLEMIVDRMRKG